MIRALILLLAALPGAAHALSCMAPNPAIELHGLLKSAHPPLVMTGALVPQGALPQRSGHEDLSARYTLTGAWLSPDDGLRDAPPVAFEVTATCVSVWCANLPTRLDHGLYLLPAETYGTRSLSLGPCGGAIYRRASLSQLQALSRCLKAGRCTDAEIEAFAVR